MTLPLARAFTCFSMFVYIRACFRFALIGGNLTAQSTARKATGELEAELKFQRRSCKLSFLFPPRRQSAPESLLAGQILPAFTGNLSSSIANRDV